MNALEIWLKQATKGLSSDSTNQVRTELQEHWKSSEEDALRGGASAEEAGRLALKSLGDAKKANYEYRKVLLTSAEAGILRSGNREARVFCSMPLARWGFLAAAAAVLVASGVFFVRGEVSLARLLLLGGIGMGFVAGAPFFSVYTPTRSRIFRSVKWVWLVALYAFAFAPLGWGWFWLLVSCLWPVAWTEYTRMSIRRKLPVSEWPKQLYL
jgi:hypothetical protein